jgi:hypothetical protein
MHCTPYVKAALHEAIACAESPSRSGILSIPTGIVKIDAE